MPLLPLLPLLPLQAAPTEAAIEKRRIRIWELGESLHCSIIGTCLSTAELRQTLRRAGVPGIEDVSEHELHILGVLAASRREQGGRMIQKALDRRHGAALTHFARAADAVALRAMWNEAVRRGEIPGAYWAVLTHPATNADMVKHAFGEVHMLSHLVGAANRADIVRLRRLEQMNAELHDKLLRQQKHLQDAFAVRDEAVRRLNAQPSNARTPAQDGAPGAAAATQALIDDLGRRLLRQTDRAGKLQDRVETMTAALREARQAHGAASERSAAIEAELELANDRLAAALGADGDSEAADGASVNLNGLTLLYVGGRAHLVPRLRAMVARLGGELVHHDGGIDDSLTLLPGLVSRADLAVFPVDCVSHGAVSAVKRLCDQHAKRYLPLRTVSLTCLLAAITQRGDVARFAERSM